MCYTENKSLFMPVIVNREIARHLRIQQSFLTLYFSHIIVTTSHEDSRPIVKVYEFRRSADRASLPHFINDCHCLFEAVISYWGQVRTAWPGSSTATWSCPWAPSQAQSRAPTLRQGCHEMTMAVFWMSASPCRRSPLGR